MLTRGEHKTEIMVALIRAAMDIKAVDAPLTDSDDRFSPSPRLSHSMSVAASAIDDNDNDDADENSFNNLLLHSDIAFGAFIDAEEASVTADDEQASKYKMPHGIAAMSDDDGRDESEDDEYVYKGTAAAATATTATTATTADDVADDDDDDDDDEEYRFRIRPSRRKQVPRSAQDVTTSAVEGRTGKTVPGKTVPGKTVPGKTVPGKTVPAAVSRGRKAPAKKTVPMTVAEIQELILDRKQRDVMLSWDKQAEKMGRGKRALQKMLQLHRDSKHAWSTIETSRLKIAGAKVDAHVDSWHAVAHFVASGEKRTSKRFPVRDALTVCKQHEKLLRERKKNGEEDEDEDEEYKLKEE
jgi:hypothetical protein